MNKKRIFFLVPYPIGQAPSQRFRFEQYLSFLENEGYQIKVSSFMDPQTWSLIYKPGFFFQKFSGICKGFVQRIVDLFISVSYDFVFIHRETTPIGPPIFEFIISKIMRKKIIYDFDDAIWIPNTSANNKIASGLKWHSKVASIAKWSWKVSCGNQYLADFAKKYNKNVLVIPTTIDTEHQHILSDVSKSTKTVIGWTGTHSTIKYLDFLIPVLQELEEKFEFEFLVISNKRPLYPLHSLRYIEWSKASEIKDLSQISIGVMPLENDRWSAGKCGFKGLQYMSLEIPTIMSPVGVNTEIIEHGKNGLLATTPAEWLDGLSRLIEDKSLSISLGKSGRKTIIERYSVLANSGKYLDLLTM